LCFEIIYVLHTIQPRSSNYALHKFIECVFNFLKNPPHYISLSIVVILSGDNVANIHTLRSRNEFRYNESDKTHGDTVLSACIVYPRVVITTASGGLLCFSYFVIHKKSKQRRDMDYTTTPRKKTAHPLTT